MNRATVLVEPIEDQLVTAWVAGVSVRPPNPLNMPGVKTLRALAVALLLLGVGGVRLANAADPSVPPATPKAQCGPGSKPETGTQGRVSTADVLSGRAAQGYTCNTEVKGHFGRTGGFRTYRYIDGAGHE